MVAIVSQKGKMFMGLINYLYEGKLENRGATNKQAEVMIHSDNLRIPYGVEDQIGRKRLIEDFIDQAKAHKNYGDHTTKYVGEHILSFKAGEVERIGKQNIKKPCEQYVRDAGIDNTQYIAVSHGDTDIFHVYIVFNRSQNNRMLYPEWKEKMKAAERAVAISLKYRLELTGNQEKLADTKGVWEARMKHQDIIDLQKNPLLINVRNLKHLEKMCEAQKILFSSIDNEIKVGDQVFQKRDLDIIFFINRQESSKTQEKKSDKTQEFGYNRKNNSRTSAHKIKRNKIESKNDEWENKKVEDRNIDSPAIIIQNSMEETQDFSHLKAWGNEDKEEKRYMKNRAILVAGSPGSGKSFGTINLAIHQLIHKGYCLYVYDFKIPTLALEVFNGLWHYKELLKQQYGSIENWQQKTNKIFPKYYQIDLKNPMKSNRINPIGSNLILEMVDASESAKFIMQGLKGSDGSDGGNKFFDQSAENLLTACIYYLKRKSNQYGQEFCSLPHVVELLQKPYEILFPLLMSDPYVKNIASTFNNAFEKGVFEQLQGQVDSLVIPMGQLSDPGIYWTFTGADFDINISNPKNPSILVIGNDPDREETYGILLSLLNGKLTKTINKKGQLPLAVILDELPMLPFNSVSNLIATARSNKVACILGIQDTSQFVLRYGKEKADMIINMVGSIVTGQIRGDLAKTVSECIGKINQEQVSEIVSAQGISYSISHQLNEAVTVSSIANLSQGEMAGTISDDFTAPLKYKRFHGRIDALAHEASPTTQMPIKEIPDLNPAFRIMEGESEEDRQNRVKIMVRENYESIKKDLVLLQYLEIIRFQFQKTESQDINLEVLAEGMLNYVIKTNKYITKDGLSPQGELFMDKLEILNTLFGNNIAPKIALSEIESQDSLVNGKTVQADKKLFSDYNSEVCQGLQAHYREFLRVYDSASVSLPADEYYDGDDF